MRKILFFLVLILLMPAKETAAKKIRHSLKIEKTSGKEKERGDKIKGKEIDMLDSVSQDSTEEIRQELRQIEFAGYEKEVSSNTESFIIINPTKEVIKGYKVKINYLDLKGRMLHSRTVENSCNIPMEETRKFDIKSWDPQRTYYYYLGNEPKRVATPYKVSFYPVSFWIEE